MPAFSRFLRYFVAVGKAGSIRRAADELNVSASAIDRQILNVEAELGLPLFERLPGGLRLTAAGEMLMASGQQWQHELAGLRSRIEDLQGLKRGHVEIATIEALAKGALPRLLASLLDRYAGISANISVLENDAARRAVIDGTADFAFLFEPESYRDLSVRAFVEVQLGLLTPPGHPLGEQATARFSHCVGYPLIVPAAPLAVAEQIAVLEGGTGVICDRKVTSDNVQMIISLVMQGAGVGILTSLDAIPEMEQGLVEFTPLADPILRPMTLALCTNNARRPSHAASVLLSEIERDFDQLAGVRKAA